MTAFFKTSDGAYIRIDTIQLVEPPPLNLPRPFAKVWTSIPMPMLANEGTSDEQSVPGVRWVKLTPADYERLTKLLPLVPVG